MTGPSAIGQVTRRAAAWVWASVLGLTLCAGCTEPVVHEAAARPPRWPAPLAELVERARERFDVPSVEAAAWSPGDGVVVDVRTADEIAVSRVPGARPLVDEAARAAFLADPPEGPVYVVCTAGWRSAEFTGWLVRAGIDAYNVEGGLCALAASGATLVDGAGRGTRRLHAYSDEFADCVPAGFEAVTE